VVVCARSLSIINRPQAMRESTLAYRRSQHCRRPFQLVVTLWGLGFYCANIARIESATSGAPTPRTSRSGAGSTGMDFTGKLKRPTYYQTRSEPRLPTVKRWSSVTTLLRKSLLSLKSSVKRFLPTTVVRRVLRGTRFSVSRLSGTLLQTLSSTSFTSHRRKSLGLGVLL
jgi:hypothetical protein